MTNTSDNRGEPESPTSRRVQIVVPDAYKKIDDEVWEELEKYIFTGFVCSTATILGKNFVFKSLNHHELKNIEFMKPARGAPLEVRASFRAHFIAYSAFMIDGTNVLYQRPRNINKLIRIISRIPANVQDKIVDNLSYVNTRAHRLYPLTEVYVHENRSRYRWLQYKNMPIHSVMATGVPGTDELGMNYSQQTWTALNTLQDRREEIERDWSNAKFIGSCMAKGVKSLDEKDRARHEKERTDIEDLKMKVLYNYLNRTESGTEPPQKMQLPDGRMATIEKKFQADSVEELADQLSAALSGEKDHHDLVVESKVRSFRDRNRIIEDQQRKIYSIPSISGDTEVGSSSRILGGREEADAHIARIQELRAKQMELARNVQLDLPISGPDTNQDSDEKLR